MKTIKKASLLFASLALVLGAGLVGNSDTKEVKAEDEVYKTLDFSKSTNESVGSYSKTWTAKVDTDEYKVVNGNNNNNGWKFVKFGSKNGTSIGSIISPVLSESISKVSITLDAINANSVNSITLSYADSASSTSWTDIGTFTKSTGAQSVTITAPISEKSYKVSFDCAKGSKNGFLQISKVEYYKEKTVVVNDAQAIIDLIDAIGTVEYSDTCKAKIDKARSTYDNAPDLQSKVTNYSVLTAAEARYAELKEEADMEVAIGVEDKIDALPAINDINDNSKVDDIYSVNDEYQKLTDDQKVFVGKDKLTKLEGLLEKLKEYPLSVEQAIAKANQTGTTATNYEYYIKGIVCKYDKTSTGKNKNFDTFKNLTFEISDDGTNSNTFMAYQANYLNKQQFESMDQIALGDIVVICGKILNYNNNTPETTGQGTAYVYSHTSAVSTFVAKVKSFDLCNASTEELKAMLDEYDVLIAKNADAANSVVDETTTLAERMAYMQLVYNKKANTTGESTSGVVITSNNSYDKTSLIALFAILGIVTISGYYIIEKKKFSK